MTVDYEHLGKLIERLPELPDPLPDEMTTFVISDRKVIFTSHGQGWRLPPSPMSQNFSYAYNKLEWDIFYRFSGARSDMLEHFGTKNGLSAHAVTDVAQLLKSSDPDKKLIGHLFLEYVSPRDQNKIREAMQPDSASTLPKHTAK